MTRQPSRSLKIVGLAILSGSLVFVEGCKEEEPVVQQTKPRPQKPVEPETPAWESVYSAMTLDPRIDVAHASYDQVSRTQMEAAFEFLHHFTTGDDASVRSMIDSQSRAVLDDLVSSGDWAVQTSEIERAVLYACRGDGSTVNVSFALQREGGDEDTLAWEGVSRGDMIVFSPSFVVEEAGANELLIEGGSGNTRGGRRSGRNNNNTRSPQRSPGNPNDPRRRVPQRGPGGPG